jgi:HD-GYP domain-containing protein (c-di-GMP phosphodiesterase class II)
MPAEAATASAALQLADERMYADKEGRASGRRQARDVILQILRESAPDLREHLDGVTGLAVQVGQQLGLPADALEELARGAELHDVGEVALPEELLHEPGPLTVEEWGFVRQHTIVGERILNAAPTLRPAALLVRSSHERWDGGGYPDALAGDAIPLGARVIAVCDSFHAMVAGRPHRPAVTAEEALAELHRCSGTQFDPRVVTAFDLVARRPTAAAAAEHGARLPV